MHGHALTHLPQNTHLKPRDLRQKKRPSWSYMEGTARLGVISSHPSARGRNEKWNWYVTKGIHMLFERKISSREPVLYYVTNFNLNSKHKNKQPNNQTQHTQEHKTTSSLSTPSLDTWPWLPPPPRLNAASPFRWSPTGSWICALYSPQHERRRWLAPKSRSTAPSPLQLVIAIAMSSSSSSSPPPPPWVVVVLLAHTSYGFIIDVTTTNMERAGAEGERRWYCGQEVRSRQLINIYQ